jgi:hypothetical protein
LTQRIVDDYLKTTEFSRPTFSKPKPQNFARTMEKRTDYLSWDDYFMGVVRILLFVEIEYYSGLFEFPQIERSFYTSGCMYS